MNRITLIALYLILVTGIVKLMEVMGVFAVLSDHLWLTGCLAFVLAGLCCGSGPIIFAVRILLAVQSGIEVAWEMVPAGTVVWARHWWNETSARSRWYRAQEGA